MNKRQAYEQITNDIPQLKRGMVWCRTCGHGQRVNSAEALRSGWPRHCGYTMTIDSPEEPQQPAANDADAGRKE
jgi:hypothetical protein